MGVINDISYAPQLPLQDSLIDPIHLHFVFIMLCRYCVLKDGDLNLNLEYSLLKPSLLR